MAVYNLIEGNRVEITIKLTELAKINFVEITYMEKVGAIYHIDTISRPYRTGDIKSSFRIIQGGKKEINNQIEASKNFIKVVFSSKVGACFDKLIQERILENENKN